MAILHNLSDIADNLSGFDPLNGISGTTGRSWVLWKVFEGFAAFDSTVKKITNASPTPAFLQGEVGSNLQTEPAQNRSTIGDSIRFYFTDDPGLSQATPHATIYEWRITHTSSRSLCTVRARYLISGGSVYAPGTDSDIINGNSNTAGYTMVMLELLSSTFTDMTNVPNIIFWKSSNSRCIISVAKGDASYRGHVLISNPSYSGYRSTIGAITYGEHLKATHFGNGGSGQTIMEGLTSTYHSNVLAIPTGISLIWLAGQLPGSLLSFDAVNNLITTYCRIGIKTDTTFKMISDQLEGIIFANANAATAGIAQIYRYTASSVWYLHLTTMSDGRDSQKLLLELGT